MLALPTLRKKDIDSGGTLKNAGFIKNRKMYFLILLFLSFEHPAA